MDLQNSRVRIFSGSSDPNLAKAIAQGLKLPLGKLETSTFSDGEIAMELKETVRGCDVYLVQSTCPPVNDNLMELLIVIDALRRASAARITAVIPYFGYGRQDRKAKARDPVSARLVADMIETAGAHRVLTMDLHAPQIQGFFKIPVDNLLGTMVLLPHFIEMFGVKNPDCMVVSPDLGSVTRCRKFAEKLDLPLAIIDKRRNPKTKNKTQVMNIIGKVKDKRVLLVDDMIDTAGTLCNAAEALIEKGKAKEVYACATHGVLSGPAIDRLQKSVIKNVFILDTIPLPKEKQIDKIKVLSAAQTFSEAIKRICDDVSVSDLFAY